MKLFTKFKQLKTKLKIVIVLLLVLSCIGVYAAGECIYSILASDVIYKDSNVQTAIDDLYDKADVCDEPPYTTIYRRPSSTDGWLVYQRISSATLDVDYVDDLNNLSNIAFDRDFAIDYSENSYLKYEIIDNVLVNTYVCGKIFSTIYCLQGGDPSYYESNRAIMDSADEKYSNIRCEEFDGGYMCYENYSGEEYANLIAYSDGRVHLRSTFDKYGHPLCNVGLVNTESTDVTAWCSRTCLDGDTEVEVYDKKKKKFVRKKLKDITKDDLIVCWDFDNGKITFIEPLWIMKPTMVDKYYLLKFSDGSELKIIGDHKVFDADRNMFVNAGADNELKIGSHVFNSKQEIVELISWEEVDEEIEAYNVILDYHMNLFANGILTSCIFSNIYPIEDMKYVKDDSEKINVENLSIDKKYIDGLRLNEVPINFRGSEEETIKYINDYVNRLDSNEK